MFSPFLRQNLLYLFRKPLSYQFIYASVIKQGFDQTTVDQIAEEADIAKGTIYNHFTEKEAIICEYVQGIIREQAPDALNLLQKLPDTVYLFFAR